MSKQYEAIKETVNQTSTEALQLALTAIGEINENTSIETIVVRNAIIDELEQRGAAKEIAQ